VVEEHGVREVTGRGAADDSRRHGACDRIAIEDRTVCLSKLKASREGALGTILKSLATQFDSRARCNCFVVYVLSTGCA
jgi:hypothetical protein